MRLRPILSSSLYMHPQVDQAAVAPYVEELLHALTLCFKDMGWPVRDAACNAFGR